tara:strand:+ start:258 stop:809 length:552 start_codon:yes stop_codon:yes gene_type:complete
MIGILAFQGAFFEHKKILDKLNLNSIIVKNVKDLEKVNSLIIPGGESSTMKKFINEEMKKELFKFINIDKKLTIGTCAGIIILANYIKNESKIIGGLDIEICRNYYGSQNDSFIKKTYNVKTSDKRDQIYIRAPKIINVGKNVEVLHKYDDIITGVKSNNIIGVTFHPEIINDLNFYKNIFIK